VREDEVALQELELVVRDVRLGELAEAGVDAVDGLSGFDHGAHRARAGRELLARDAVQLEGLVRAREGREVGELERAGTSSHARDYRKLRRGAIRMTTAARNPV
jgi:hypothetical protein